VTYPEYIKGTSLFGYFNQMVAASAFPARFHFADKNHPYQQRNTPIYIYPFLTETYSAGLGEMIGEILPPDIFEEIRESAASSVFPFDASPVTFDLLFEKELKYCPKCMAGGEHYYYQQLKSSHVCRKHSVPLMKGCPVCGAPLPSSIEILELDAFHCPTCLSRFAGFREPVELVCMLDEAKKNEPEEPDHIQFNERKAFLATMNRSGDVFFNQQFFTDAQNYLKTGKRPDGAIEISKAGKADNSFLTAVIPYTGGLLNKRSKLADIYDYIGNSEDPSATPEHRAGAYLARKLLGHHNPRRFGIESMKTTNYLITKAFQEAGIKDPKLIAGAALKHYTGDMHEHVLELFKDSNNASLLLLVSGKPVSELRYSMMVLEDKEKYYLYMYKAEEDLDDLFLTLGDVSTCEKLDNITINDYVFEAYNERYAAGSTE